MDTLMKADIFFFVTTVVVTIFGILGTVAFLYLIGILRDIRRASRKLEGELEAIGNGAEELYRTISESFLFKLLFGRYNGRISKK